MQTKLPLVAPNGFVAIDTLCGAGGMTLAQYLAGFRIGAALNHWQLALDSQAVYFPGVPHFCADVRTQHANALGLAHWFHMSPDCRHHSRAKGGKPVDPSVRALAEEAPRYLVACGALVATFENVPEFMDWGPERLKRDADGNVVQKLNKKTGEMEDVWEAIPERKGEYYRRWVDTLKAMGYVNHQAWILDSANYGSAQSRRRYFGVFARAGIRIPKYGPKPTHDEHGRNGLPKWRGAIEILELDNYGESVFEGEPYVDATLRRLTAGVKAFAAEAQPWILKYNSNPPSGKPNPGSRIFQPLHTLACQRREGVVRPVFAASYYKSGTCRSLLRPLATLPTKDRFMIASTVRPAFTFSHQFGNTPRLFGSPLRTLLASRRHQYAAFAQLAPLGLVHYYSGGGQRSSLLRPLPCITAQRHKARLLHGVRPLGFFHYYGPHGLQISKLGRPLPTITSGAQARAMFGDYGPGCPDKLAHRPSDTQAMRDLKDACRAAGLIDLLCRMLTVREAFRGQGFPDWYNVLGNQTQQRKMIGNAVEVNTGLAVASEVRRMLDRFVASGRTVPPLKIRPVERWEQSHLFAELQTAA